MPAQILAEIGGFRILHGLLQFHVFAGICYGIHSDVSRNSCALVGPPAEEISIFQGGNLHGFTPKIDLRIKRLVDFKLAYKFIERAQRPGADNAGAVCVHKSDV